MMGRALTRWRALTRYSTVLVNGFSVMSICLANNKLTYYLLERKVITASLQLREGKKLPLDDLVKGSVAQGHAPPPPEAHVIEYAMDGVVHHIELDGRSFTCYFS